MKKEIHHYPTRGTNQLYLPRFNTYTYERNSLNFKGPYDWNQFLNNVQNYNEIKTVTVLKNLLYKSFVKDYTN